MTTTEATTIDEAEAVQEEPIRKFQILYGETFNPPFRNAVVMAKNLDEIKEMIKPNILTGAFVTLK